MCVHNYKQLAMEYTRRSITSLTELKPGDHIVVEDSAAQHGGKTSGKETSHHLLVVEALDHTHVKVIHSVTDTPDSVKEERKRYSPRHVKMLDYDPQYTGEAAIMNARQMKLKNMKKPFAGIPAMMQLEHTACYWKNSENFVVQARTGDDKSIPGGKLKEIAAGAGGGVGIGLGALIGGIFGSVVPFIGTAIGATVGAAIAGAGVAGTVAIATAIEHAAGAGMKRACCIHIQVHELKHCMYMYSMYLHNIHVALYIYLRFAWYIT